MKTIRNLFVFLSVAFLISCAEHTSDMVTVIQPDGSCYREFVVRVPYSFLTGDTVGSHNLLPVAIDSGSKVSWSFRNSEWKAGYPVKRAVVDSLLRSAGISRDSAAMVLASISDFRLKIRMDYRSVDEMAGKFKLSKSNEWSSLKVKYELNKRFRWFYTYYDYRETYPCLRKSFIVPVDKYLTPEEARFWFTGQPDLMRGMNGLEAREYLGNLEDRYNRWFAHNLWRAEFDELLANYDLVKSQPLPKERLKMLADTIFESKVTDPDFKMDEVLDTYFATHVFGELWKAHGSRLKGFDDNFCQKEFMSYFSQSFNYKLLMPGKVLEYGNAIPHGDTLVWKLTAHRFYLDDYVLEAKSRRTNVWAFVLTVIVLVVAVGSFFWKPNKHR